MGMNEVMRVDVCPSRELDMFLFYGTLDDLVEFFVCWYSGDVAG